MQIWRMDWSYVVNFRCLTNKNNSYAIFHKPHWILFIRIYIHIYIHMLFPCCFHRFLRYIPNHLDIGILIILISNIRSIESIGYNHQLFLIALSSYREGWLKYQYQRHVLKKSYIVCRSVCPCFKFYHHCGVIMGTLASQINSLTIIYSTFYFRRRYIKAPRHWPLCGEFTGDRWIPRTNGPVTRKIYPFDDDIMMHMFQVQ